MKISETSIILLANTSWHNCALLVNIIAVRPCNFGGELSTKRFFQVKTCVRNFALVSQILHEQTNQCIFLVFAASQFFLHYDITGMHTYPCANFGAQTPENKPLTSKLHVCMFGFCEKLILFRRDLQSLDRVYYLNCIKCSCTFICKRGIPFRPQNPVGKLQKLGTHHPKQFFGANSVPKFAIFCACVQMFGKHSMFEVRAMLLRNH